MKISEFFLQPLQLPSTCLCAEAQEFPLLILMEAAPDKEKENHGNFSFFADWINESREKLSLENSIILRHFFWSLSSALAMIYSLV